MQDETIPPLRGLRLFSAAREDTCARLAAHGGIRCLAPGTVIIHEGSAPECLHIVLDGLVEMFATSAGRETTLDLVRPTRGFILAAVVSDLVQLQSARALEETRLLTLPAGEVRAALADDAGLMQAVIAELGRGYRNTLRSLKGRKLRSSTVRLANWLLRLRTARGDAAELTLDIEKRTLAALLGMTPEHLSRAFSALREHGVDVHGAAITITDPAALAALAHPDPLLDAED